MKRITMIVCTILLLVPSAHATKFVYNFSGVVTESYVPTELDWLASGTTFTGTFEYEYASSVVGYNGWYNPDGSTDASISTSFSMVFGENLYAYVERTSVDYFQIANDSSLDCLRTWTEGGAYATYNGYAYNGYDAEIDFADNSGSAFSSNLIEDLPSLDNPLLDFNRIWFSGGGSYPWIIKGQISNVCQVPEPAAIMLLSLGFMMVGFLRKKK